jgi:dTDP-4-amino-4,6-dideoxygalactose transaminase
MIKVKEFEDIVKTFYNAPYAVAVDCCTHAIELCLRLKQPLQAFCPLHTYVSVPMTLKKLNISWTWTDLQWENYYHITSDIIDAAVYWQENGYKPNTMMCLSFQFKKHLNIGRGGMILLDNESDYTQLCKMRYDGRLEDIPWMEQNIDTMGYHYYMTPESAEIGIKKFYEVRNFKAKKWSYKDYPDLTKMRVFEND